MLALIFITLNFEYSFLNGLFVYKPWRLYMLVCSMISGTAWMAMMFLPESPEFLLAMGKQEKALEILRMIYAVNNRKLKHVCVST